MPRFKNRRIVASIQAIAAFVAGILITFSQSHSANVGMVALAIMSIGWALAFAWSAIKDKTVYGRIGKGLIVAASSAMAILAIGLAGSIRDGEPQITGPWPLLISWGLAGAFTEVILALSAKPGSGRRRDHLISAGLAAAFGLTQFFTPSNDSVTHVGFLGAYAVILSVHLGLSVLSPANKSAGKKAGNGKKSVDAKSKSKK
mgnify:CR=1 FL=1|jgi:hypothetical protein